MIDDNDNDDDTDTDTDEVDDDQSLEGDTLPSNLRTLTYTYIHT